MLSSRLTEYRFFSICANNVRYNTESWNNKDVTFFFELTKVIVMFGNPRRILFTGLLQNFDYGFDRTLSCVNISFFL